MTNTRTNEFGNTVNERFVGPNRERYAYDFEICRHSEGWRQYDTEQDAPYFGIWVHERRREIVTFAEGDESRVLCTTVESFRAELASMAKFYGPPPPAFILIGMDGARTEIYDSRPTGAGAASSLEG